MNTTSEQRLSALLKSSEASLTASFSDYAQPLTDRIEELQKEVAAETARADRAELDRDEALTALDQERAETRQLRSDVQTLSSRLSEIIETMREIPNLHDLYQQRQSRQT